MNNYYYDIESLENVFTCAIYKENTNTLHIFYLIDNKDSILSENWKTNVKNKIFLRNPILRKNENIILTDISDINGIKHFAKIMGVSLSSDVCDIDKKDIFLNEYRPICTTDENYNENIHPYMMGYNSTNYDTTIMAKFFENTMQDRFNIIPTTAAEMRKINDTMFKKYKKNMPNILIEDENENTNYNSNGYKIRKNMLRTGRYIDVAKLNEKQQKIALKRLLGTLGYQILESDKLSKKAYIENEDELCELIAYNCSDVIYLKKLFYHKKYYANFTLKKQLLSTYPETIYNKKENTYKPDINYKNVKKNRLTIDSSSAQFATQSLCPYGHLKDIQFVSFNYPSKNIAEKLGIKQINVLEESKKFIEQMYPDNKEIQENFNRIYKYYKSIEGKNFNPSNNYYKAYIEPLPEKDRKKYKTYKISDIPKENTYMLYYDKYGKPTSCYVLFSTGGIHGAEYNKELYDYDEKIYKSEKKNIEDIKEKYTADEFLSSPFKYYTKKDGTIIKKKDIIANKEFKEPIEPKLIKNINGKWTINEKYSYTSSDASNHEDFESYYPNLLRMIEAFYNAELGYDRYGDIFYQKQKYGRLRKDETKTKEEIENFDNLRNGTKLILNSASGAGDAKFDNNILVPNRIISMRIIGQLFSWRIGQAQSFKGAKMISTNTDGLYSVMNEKENNKILENESKDIGINIEPERLYLISKDSNNRLELNEDSMTIISASGGTLGCQKGPDPEKSLNHPAIIDWALCQYLIETAKGTVDITQDFNKDIGIEILKKSFKTFSKLKTVLMYQNIISISANTMAYPFGINTETGELKALQHYNRVFITKDGTKDTYFLKKACAKKIPENIKLKRKEENKTRKIDITAKKILKLNNEEIPLDKDLTVDKITDINTEWYMYIENKDLHLLKDEELDKIIEKLDIEKYNEIVESKFNNNWKNKKPEKFTYVKNSFKTTPEIAEEVIRNICIDKTETDMKVIDNITDEEIKNKIIEIAKTKAAISLFGFKPKIENQNSQKYLCIEDNFNDSYILENIDNIGFIVTNKTAYKLKKIECKELSEKTIEKRISENGKIYYIKDEKCIKILKEQNIKEYKKNKDILFTKINNISENEQVLIVNDYDMYDISDLINVDYYIDLTKKYYNKLKKKYIEI